MKRISTRTEQVQGTNLRVGSTSNTDMVEEQHKVLPKVVTRVTPKDLMQRPNLVVEHPLPLLDIDPL